jgi:hypothetical protein
MIGAKDLMQTLGQLMGKTCIEISFACIELPGNFFCLVMSIEVTNRYCG